MTKRQIKTKKETVRETVVVSNGAWATIIAEEYDEETNKMENCFRTNDMVNYAWNGIRLMSLYLKKCVQQMQSLGLDAQLPTQPS